MFCSSCGQYCADSAKFCPNCGAPLAANSDSRPDSVKSTVTVSYGQSNVQGNAQSAADSQSGNGFAIASLVMGILSLLCCMPVITNILAIVFFFVAKRSGSRSPMAVAGLVCGIVGLVCILLVFASGFARTGWSSFRDAFMP